MHPKKIKTQKILEHIQYLEKLLAKIRVLCQKKKNNGGKQFFPNYNREQQIFQLSMPATKRLSQDPVDHMLWIELSSRTIHNISFCKIQLSYSLGSRVMKKCEGQLCLRNEAIYLKALGTCQITTKQARRLLSTLCKYGQKHNKNVASFLSCSCAGSFLDCGGSHGQMAN